MDRLYMSAFLPSYTRHTEWWEHKVTLFLFTGLLAIYFVKPESISNALIQLFIVLFAIVVCAIYVSVINDLTDRDDDRKANKTNRTTKLSTNNIATILTGLIALGFAFTWYFWTNPLTSLFYMGSWAAYSLYSFPPVRLKRRGWIGALADAAGAHLFTTLTILSAMSDALHVSLPPSLYLFLGGWSTLFGLRGILWHQYRDLQNDLRANIRTFATMVPATTMRRLQTGILLAELFFFSGMLWLCGLTSLLILLPLYGFYILMIWKRMKLEPVVIVAPDGNRWIFVMSSFYQTLLPISLMIMLAEQHYGFLLLIPIHMALFPNDIRTNVSIIKDLIRNMTR